ncbi:hypothetical protein MRB53_041341 [Persea americana]|nr:hypothetical protein MRB53_041341 [Persea americana]
MRVLDQAGCRFAVSLLRPHSARRETPCFHASFSPSQAAWQNEGEKRGVLREREVGLGGPGVEAPKAHRRLGGGRRAGGWRVNRVMDRQRDMRRNAACS